MKTLISITAVALSLLTVPAAAQSRHHHGHNRPHHDNSARNLFVPLIIGGAIGYALAPQPRPEYVESRTYPTLIIPQDPEYGSYNETARPTMYRRVLRWDEGCRCHREVFIPLQP